MLSVPQGIYVCNSAELSCWCRYHVSKKLPKEQPTLSWQSGQQISSSALAMPLSRDDFVAAIVTDESHEQFAHAGRAWRQASLSHTRILQEACLQDRL